MRLAVLENTMSTMSLTWRTSVAKGKRRPTAKRLNRLFTELHVDQNRLNSSVDSHSNFFLEY